VWREKILKEGEKESERGEREKGEGEKIETQICLFTGKKLIVILNR
jgi:hypothetical protein